MKRLLSLRSILPLLLAITLLLAACGANQEEKASDVSSSPSPTVADSEENDQKTVEQPEETPQTRLFTDALQREVEIPSDPQKIVALWTVGEMLALDAKPAGSSQHMLRFYSDAERQGIEVVGESLAPDMESVLALEPDLIVVHARTAEDELEQYSKIAPTVATPFFGDPIVRFQFVADLLGRPEAATAWLKDYDNAVAETRERVAPLNVKGQSALVIQFAQKNIYLYPSSTFPSVFDAYEFALTDKQQGLEADGDFAPMALSQESLPEFDADYIFVIVNDDDSQSVYDEMLNSGVWQGLRAVKDGHVYDIGNRLSTNDVLNMRWALDEIYKLLNP